MNKLVIALLSLAAMLGPLFAADNRPTGIPGTDDLSRYIAIKAAPGGRTILRDASGRTVGTASTLGSRTTTFRDSSGRTAGTATM